MMSDRCISCKCALSSDQEKNRGECGFCKRKRLAAAPLTAPCQHLRVNVGGVCQDCGYLLAAPPGAPQPEPSSHPDRPNRCCDNGDFGDNHVCQKQPGPKAEVASSPSPTQTSKCRNLGCTVEFDHIDDESVRSACLEIHEVSCFRQYPHGIGTEAKSEWVKVTPEKYGIYFASKTKYAARWRNFRAMGWPVISSWIDEAGIGETKSFSDLWLRCISEPMRAERLILYVEDGDELKGALVEVGAALAGGTPVYVVGNVEPLKTAKNHPLVKLVSHLAEALSDMSELPSPPEENRDE